MQSLSIEASSHKTTRKDSSSSEKKLKCSYGKNPPTSVDANANFSKGLERLAQSNIIASRMDMSATLRTNILSLENEHRGLDMALMDDPPLTMHFGYVVSICAITSGKELL